MIARLLSNWLTIVAALLGWLSFAIAFWRLTVAKGQLKTTREQLGVAQRQLALSISKATHHISSRCKYRISPIEGRPDVRRYAVFTEVYNEGDLVARNVEGQWKLTASHEMYSGDKAISVESLSTSRPWEHKHEIGGSIQWMRSNPDATIQVNIDLVYSGIDKKQTRYSATYTYDHVQEDMIRVKDSENG